MQSQPTDQQLEDAFALFDKDQDGILNTEELMVSSRATRTLMSQSHANAWSASTRASG